MNSVKDLNISLFILLLLVSLGTTGYMVIEGWRFVEHTSGIAQVVDFLASFTPAAQYSIPARLRV